MRKLAAFVLLLAVSSTHAASPPTPAADSQKGVQPGLEGLVWNKWDTENFVVISLDRFRGSAMRREVESVRKGVTDRWCISGGEPVRCKLVFVPDAPMLKKLFGLSEPKCEYRTSESGGPEAAIWIDDERVSLLPSLIADLELSRGGFGSFARRGVPLLERSSSEVRAALAAAGERPLASVLGDSKPNDDPLDLARNSAVACLMIRKELGAQAFGRAIKSPPNQVHDRLGFASAAELEGTFRRYRANLISDLKAGRTPDEYLGVRR